MDTMRRKVIWVGGLSACVLAVAIGVRAAVPVPVKVGNDVSKLVDIRLDDVRLDRLRPLPSEYVVKTHYPDGSARNKALAGTPLPCGVDTKQVYTSTLGQFLFPPGFGTAVADDLITELVTDCSICSLSVRVNGGIEDGTGFFFAQTALFDRCPVLDDGAVEIPGTRKTFGIAVPLSDDIGQMHDLILDFSDRGICTDLSACEVSQQNCGDDSVCQPDPLEIPSTVWLRIFFSTEEASVVVGSPPTRGFSADAYDSNPGGRCTAWFGGWPTFPHATFYSEIISPVDCPTHFLAYLAANPNKAAFLPSQIPGRQQSGQEFVFTNPSTRLGDDITLTVQNCTLSAYELGMKGTSGPFSMDIDLRWPDLNSIVPDTVRTFDSIRGTGSAEIGHFTIPPEIDLNIGPNDQPIAITWSSTRSNTGAMEVNITQAGTAAPTFFAFDTDPLNPDEWDILAERSNPLFPGAAPPDLAEQNPFVAYAAIFCRGDAPRGACCPDQTAVPGLDANCFDGGEPDHIGVPVTSCFGARWLINRTCAENAFSPPCGTHACCLPSSNCEDRTFDDCVEECISDSDPIFCEPVCVGGPNARLPCAKCDGGPNIGLLCSNDLDCQDAQCVADDSLCPGAQCDATGDALCPGSRTCGLTSCQNAAGQFTGRPCDLNGLNQGAGDCMTCSSSGEFCRPRCVGGTRDGLPCNFAQGNADCPPTGTCDNNAACPLGQACISVQTCGHDANQCALRCSHWTRGEFCGEGDQFCPNFTCFDAVGDCFEEDVPIECNGRCQQSKPCPNGNSDCEDSNGDPIFGVCGPDGNCTGFPCFGISADAMCDQQGLGVCVESDLDCPPGRFCLGLINRICSGREGCDNLRCCDAVCNTFSECCDSSQGETWDSSCVAVVNNPDVRACQFPPGNDDCWSARPNEGASDILLLDDDTSTPCSGASTSCSGGKSAPTANAKSSNDDPGFCCNLLGVGRQGVGTIWFKFTAAHSSARVHNCGTAGSPSVNNSMIQVFRATNITDDGSDFDECNSLEVIGCNDDSGNTSCGSSGGNCPTGDCLADACVTGLTPGKTYYILMAASEGTNLGVYDIDIESPCPDTQLPPSGSICESAVSIQEGPVGMPFDLTNATIDCPAETALPTMTNDTWFQLASTSCTGNLLVQTCGFDLGEPNPDTTLAVYVDGNILPPGGIDCPPALPLSGGNDNATFNPVCSIGNLSTGIPALCDVSRNGTDCILGCTGPLPVGGTPCDSDDDCPGNSVCDTTQLAICETKVDGFGTSSEAPCLDSTDCDRAICADDLSTPCDLATFLDRHCLLDGAPCDDVTPCPPGDFCEPECGFDQFGLPWECLAQETCVPATCGSQCAPASMVVVPVFIGDLAQIRIGGIFGSEPSGTLRVSCVPDDCNTNGFPDLIDIEIGAAQDCNGNLEPDECDIDSGFSDDCNCNGVPDECDMNIDSVIDCSLVTGPCDEGPFFCVEITSGDCDPDINNNGLPDCCDTGVPPADCVDCLPPCGMAGLTGVVFADAGGVAADPSDRPGNCDIDAREPFDLNNSANRNGWDRMILSFSCDPALAGMLAGDFTVSFPPAVTVFPVGSLAVDSVANTATVILNDMITPGQWTCIAHPASGNEWCMGYLPGSANQDLDSLANDIDALISSINLGPALPLYAGDMNRSGIANGQDILRLIDLLNGASQFDVWITQNLDPCPSP